MLKIIFAPLLFVFIALLCFGCGNDDNFTPPAYSDELALSRIESNGNVVYAGNLNKLSVFQVNSNGQFQELSSVPVSGQVQDLLAADNRLFLALPEKVAAYSAVNPAMPEWQYQVEANPLVTNLGYTNGLFGLLHITDTAGVTGIYNNHQRGRISFYSNGLHPLYEVVTPFRESQILASAPGVFLIGEEEQLLVYPTDSLQSSYISQTLNLRLLGLQATPTGFVATASANPRVLSFYQLQQGQLQLQSQIPLAP